MILKSITFGQSGCYLHAKKTGKIREKKEKDNCKMCCTKVIIFLTIYGDFYCDNSCLNILLHSDLATLYGLIKSFSEREQNNKVQKKTITKLK